MRTFVAIEIPEGIRKKIYATGAKIPGRMIPVSEDNIHITLQFLGELDDAQLAKAKQALDAVTMPEFVIMLKGMSYFGGRNMHTIFANVFDKGRTNALYFDIGKALTDFGLDYRTEREYTPHATIARVKQEGADTKKFISQNSEYLFGEFIAKSVCLRKSVLSSDGPVYTTLHERELG